MVVVSDDVQACKRCSRCKEILGLEQFYDSGTSSWCRTCRSECSRAYRRTARYRKAEKARRERPEVRQARREAMRRWDKTGKRTLWRKSIRGKLLNQRANARLRARRYETAGKFNAARKQWDRVNAITDELARIDRGTGQ